jgi:hypothetical protein
MQPPPPGTGTGTTIDISRAVKPLGVDDVGEKISGGSASAQDWVCFLECLKNHVLFLTSYKEIGYES